MEVKEAIENIEYYIDHFIECISKDNDSDADEVKHDIEHEKAGKKQIIEYIQSLEAENKELKETNKYYREQNKELERIKQKYIGGIK